MMGGYKGCVLLSTTGMEPLHRWCKHEIWKKKKAPADMTDLIRCGRNLSSKGSQRFHVHYANFQWYTLWSHSWGVASLLSNRDGGGGGEGEICLLLRIFPLPTISPLLPKQNFFKLLKDKGRESYSITKLEVFPRMTLENFRAASPR